MATVTITCGASGENQTSGFTTTVLNAAANTKYRVTGFSLDYINNGAYIYDMGGNQFTLSLNVGGSTVTIGTYSRSANGTRPAISWSGAAYGANNSAVTFSSNPVSSSKPAGFRNQYKITITYETITRPTVSVGSTVTNAQIAALYKWANGTASSGPGVGVKITPWVIGSAGRILYASDYNTK